jgi:hypothetical protein
MTEKHELPPQTRELSQPDYRERVQTAFTRPKVSSAETPEMVAAGWRHMEWVTGDISSIKMLESGRVEIEMWAWTSEMQDVEHSRTHYFRFRKPEDDFLAEARRSQSHGLAFEFGCYAKYPLDPEGPFLVQQITYYEVWGRPHIRADPMYLPVWVDVKNKLLPVKVQ